MKQLLVRKEVKAWLEAKPEGAAVGARCVAGSCPLAHFLREEGYQYVTVNGVTYQIGLDSFTCPAWAYNFIKAIDWDEAGVNRYGSVTREEALAALESTNRRERGKKDA